MALLTLAKLMDSVLDEIPGKEQAAIVRSANRVIRRIQTEYVAPKRSTFTTVASTTTGTVNVTQGSTTATFSASVLLTTDPVRLVQIEGDSSWFEVTRNSADTAGVLSSKWAEATDTTATHEIVYPLISFPAGVGEILSVWRAGHEPLHFAVNETEVGWHTVVGTPTYWSPYVHDDAAATPNDDLLRIRLHPVPNTRMVYQYLYKPRTTELDPAGLTTQTVPLPDLWNEAVEQGTLFFLWKQESRNEKAMLQSAVFEAALERARGAQFPATVIMPSQSRAGLHGYEDRPIG